MSLNQIKKDLCQYHKSRQPVLLYGKDDYGRKELIQEVHSADGSSLSSWKYLGDNQGIQTNVNLEMTLKRALADLKKKVKNKLKTINTSRVNELVSDCNDNIKTFYSIDNDNQCGQTILKTLMQRKYRSEREGTIIFEYIPKGLGTGEPLLLYKGTLFIDNLECRENHIGDKESYKELAYKIEKLIEKFKRNPKYKLGWFAFYAYDYKTFPARFLDQFKLIELEKSDYKAPIIITWDSSRRLLVYKKKEAELMPIQLKLLIFLYENKNSLNTRNDIYKCLWGHEPTVYDHQINEHISSIITAFDKIDIGYTRQEIKKHIIKTVKSSRNTQSEGGYIFESKLVTLEGI